MNKNFALAGIVLGLGKPIDIPADLQDFLTMDEMDGIADFELMLKDEKLCRRIPSNVRAQYEMLYATLSCELDEICNNLEQSLKEMKANPKVFIHDLIQHSLEKSEEYDDAEE